MARLRDRQLQTPCADRRLAELQALLDDAGAHGRFATPQWVGRPQAWTMERSRWGASSQAGRAALLSADELALYASMYALMDSLNELLPQEAADWARLRSLEHLQSLSPQMHFDLTNTLGDARYLNWRVNTRTIELEDDAARLHLGKVRNVVRGSNSICVPLGTPRAQALRLSQSPELWRYGEP